MYKGREEKIHNGSHGSNILYSCSGRIEILRVLSMDGSCSDQPHHLNILPSRQWGVLDKRLS